MSSRAKRAGRLATWRGARVGRDVGASVWCSDPWLRPTTRYGRLLVSVSRAFARGEIGVSPQRLACQRAWGQSLQLPPHSALPSCEPARWRRGRGAQQAATSVLGRERAPWKRTHATRSRLRPCAVDGSAQRAIASAAIRSVVAERADRCTSAWWRSVALATFRSPALGDDASPTAGPARETIVVTEAPRGSRASGEAVTRDRGSSAGAARARPSARSDAGMVCPQDLTPEVARARGDRELEARALLTERAPALRPCFCRPHASVVARSQSPAHPILHSHDKTIRVDGCVWCSEHGASGGRESQRCARSARRGSASVIWGWPHIS